MCIVPQNKDEFRVKHGLFNSSICTMLFNMHHISYMQSRYTLDINLEYKF